MKSFYQFRDLGFDRVPNDFIVQTEILMCDYISQAGNFAPGNFRMFRFEASRHLSCRLANHFQTADYRQIGAAIFSESFRITHSLCEIKNVPTGLQNVIHI